ncbi:MAG: PhnD/SsuA/transferrin family substrate-binding protein [Candidatus Bipolaricaulia bacterium]
MRLPMVKSVLVVALVALLGAGMVSTVNIGGVGAQEAQLGTRENPIIWLFPPSTQPATVKEISAKIAQDISEMTGYYIQAVVAADYSALIEAMVAAQGDHMAVPTTNQYVEITKDNPGVHARLAAVRYGYPYYFSSIYAFRDKGFKSVEDLQGKVWIYNDPGSTSGYKLPKLLFDKLGITFSGTVESGGHTNSVVALMEEQGDFATGYGSPPLPPAAIADALKAAGLRWEYGMDPEKWLWDRWNNALEPDGWRGTCVDLRRALAKTELYGDIWEIVEKVGVVATIGPVPNDSIAFAAGFPKEIEDTLVQAIIQHIRSPEGQALWGDPNFYEWTDVEEIDDSYYDSYRELLGYPIPQRGG